MRTRTQLIFNLLKTKHDPSQILVKLALRDALAGCESVLDVGCGASPTMREIGVPRSVGAEGYKPSIERALKEKLQDEMVECNIRQLSEHFSPRQFDACVAMDVIEHLNKADGLALMKSMEAIAKKRVVFFTPNGFLPQRHAANDDLEEHLSGWDPAEMRGFGYRVTGLLGPKKLRGEYHSLKKSPAAFWGIVSLAGQCFWTRSHPETAAAIFCVKSLDK